MSKVEAENYRKAISNAYSEHLEGNPVMLLTSPTETNVYNELLRILRHDLPKEDVEAIMAWYGVHRREDLFSSIENKSNGNKFKNLSEFLNGKGNNLNVMSLNVVAVLIDFNPRPFSKFKAKRKEVASFKTGSETETKRVFINEDFSNEEVLAAETQKGEKVKTKKSNFLLKWSMLVILAFGLFSVVYHFISKEEKSCMAWMGNKYETVPCNTKFLDQKGIIVQMNNGTMNIENFRRISPTQETAFYDSDGNPQVWYANNVAGNPDFFNQRGNHPITNAPLKPVPLELVARYKYVVESIGEAETDRGNAKEKKILPKSNFLNENFINSDANETAVLAFSGKEIDTALIQAISEKISEKDKRIIQLFYPQKFTVEQKKAFAMGDFSAVSNLEKFADDIIVASASYDFRKSNTNEQLIVCSMDITYFLYNTISKTKARTKDLTVAGSGFSIAEAKQNALKKIFL